MELGHLVLGGLVRSVHFHLSVEPIVEQEVMGHPHPVWLHRMALAIVVVADVAVIIVADFRLAVTLHRSLLI